MELLEKWENCHAMGNVQHITRFFDKKWQVHPYVFIEECAESFDFAQYRIHRKLVVDSFPLCDMARITPRGVAATKFEIRISKYETISNDKNSMLQILRKSHLINVLWLGVLKNAHKKQEVYG